MALTHVWTCQGQGNPLSSIGSRTFLSIGSRASLKQTISILFHLLILPLILLLISLLFFPLISSLPFLSPGNRLAPAQAFAAQAFTARINSLEPPQMSASGDYLVTARGSNLNQVARVVLAQSFPYLKGTISSAGVITALEFKNPYVYAIADYSRILVIDVSDPNRLEVKKTFQDPQFSKSLNSIKLADNYLLITDLLNGLWVIDISNPLLPKRKTLLQDPSVHGVLVGNQETASGGEKVRKIYLTSWKYGLKIYDWSSGDRFTSKLSSPITWDKLSPNNLDVQVHPLTHERYIYIANNHSVTIIQESSGRVSSFDEYFFIDSALPPGSSEFLDIKVKDTYMYLIEGTYGLYVVDIKDPGHPVVLSRLHVPEGRESITIRKDLAIVCAGLSGLDLIDISQPSNPGFRHHIPTQGNAVCAVIGNEEGNYAFIANGDAGFALMDIQPLSIPASVGHLSMDGDIWDIKVAADRAYVSMGRLGLKVVNVADPWNPRLDYCIDKADIGEDAVLIRECCPYQNGLYLADGSNLCIFKSSSGQGKPSLIKTISSFQPIQSMTIQDNYLYKLSQAEGLRIFEIDARLNLTSRGGLALGSMPQRILVKDRLAYVASGTEGLWIVNVSDPAKPYKISQKSFPPALVRDVGVKDNYAYLVNAGYGMSVVDVTSAHIANPSLSQTMEFKDEYLDDGFIQGNFLYAAGHFSGVWIMDLSTPASPAILDNMLTSKGARSVFADQEYIYAGNQFGMLDIYLAPRNLPLEYSPKTPGGGTALDPNSIRFHVPAGLPHGFYDLIFLNAQGEKIRSYQAMQIGKSIPLDLKAGLNLFGYPGKVPAEYSTSYQLMGSLDGIARSLQQQNPKKVSSWQSHTLRGDIFAIKERRGYLLYVLQERLFTGLSTDYFYPLDTVLHQIGSDLQEGTNLVSFPIEDKGVASFEIFGRLRELPQANGLSGMQRLNPASGKWESTYGFYNQRGGQNFPIGTGEGYLVTTNH